MEIRENWPDEERKAALLAISNSFAKRLAMERKFTLCILAGAMVGLVAAFFIINTLTLDMSHLVICFAGAGALIASAAMSGMSEFKRIRHGKHLAMAPVQFPDALREKDGWEPFLDKAEDRIRAIKLSQKFMRNAFLFLIIGVCAIFYAVGNTYLQDLRRAESSPEINHQTAFLHQYELATAASTAAHDGRVQFRI